MAQRAWAGGLVGLGQTLGILVGAGLAIIGGGVAPELGAGLRPPWGLLIAVVLVGTGVAALAGLYPARVAGSLPIVRSLKHFE